jgi:hypothetical protein
MDLRSSSLTKCQTILAMEPFSLKKSEKDSSYLNAMSELTNYHRLNCNKYDQIVSNLAEARSWNMRSLESIPFIPVSLFKKFELSSVDSNEIFKVMHSSGTSGQEPSKIILDRETSKNQSLILLKLFKEFIPLDRPPILIIDSESTIKNRKSFSARTAGILGFSFLGRDATFALDENFELDIEKIQSFLNKYEFDEFLIFGFTSLVWEFFIKKIKGGIFENRFYNSYLLHGGGWKKLQNLNIDNHKFKQEVLRILGTSKVLNYYGLVEQTGSLYFECSQGFFHTSVFSNVIVREKSNFESLPIGESGILQLQSVLPKSYPGHSILTEDLGELRGIDNCLCGRLGQTFSVLGRIPQAEVRGCSDTFEG